MLTFKTDHRGLPFPSDIEDAASNGTLAPDTEYAVLPVKEWEAMVETLETLVADYAALAAAREGE